jgi:hypothetical protein
MEALGQLLETAQWAPQPLALCIDGASTLNRRVLVGMCPQHLVALRVHGAGVCDELLEVIQKLPVVTSVALAHPARNLSRTGLAALAGTRTLTDLALTGSNICDEGAASLQRLTKLVSLDISGSSALSDLGAKVLIAKGHDHLKCVSLLDTSHITARALVEIGILEFELFLRSAGPFPTAADIDIITSINARAHKDRHLLARQTCQDWDCKRASGIGRRMLPHLPCGSVCTPSTNACRRCEGRVSRRC